MKDLNIRLLSVDAGNIYVNGSLIGLIDNQKVHCIDLKVYSEKLIITKEPISSKKKLLLPYTIQLSTSNGVGSDNELATVVPFPNNSYDIILQPCEIKQYKNLKKVYDDFVDNYNIVVVNNGQSYINIYKLNVLKYSTVVEELSQISASKKSDYVIVKAINNKGQYFVLVLNEAKDFEEAICTSADELEDQEEKLKLLVKINDIAKHAKVITLNYQQPQAEQPHYVYLKDSAVTTQSKQLLPFAFLEAIKVGNHKLAKEYLSPELKEKTTKQHLTNYFNNLTEIYYNTHFTAQPKVNYTVFCNNKYKNYNFEIVNNKIADIDEVQI